MPKWPPPKPRCSLTTGYSAEAEQAYRVAMQISQPVLKPFMAWANSWPQLAGLIGPASLSPIFDMPTRRSPRTCLEVTLQRRGWRAGTASVKVKPGHLSLSGRFTPAATTVRLESHRTALAYLRAVAATAKTRSTARGLASIIRACASRLSPRVTAARPG